jgi:hypothetical protein
LPQGLGQISEDISMDGNLQLEFPDDLDDDKLQNKPQTMLGRLRFYANAIMLVELRC